MSDATGMKMRTRACAAMTVLALSASACGGAGGATTTAASEVAEDVVSTTSAVEVRAADPGTTAVVAVGADTPTADVLAYAIESAESLSYSFEQGMSINMNLLGETLNASSNGPLATGVISGENQQINTDISGFMMSAFESMGLAANDPSFAALDLSSLTMDAWVVDGTLVMDLSGIVDLAVLNDPAAVEELSAFADGPVSIDLEQLSALGVGGGFAATDLMTQFSQGAQITNPSKIVDALGSVDSLTEIGNQEENGVEVTVYEADITLAEYTEALGQTIEDGAGSFGDIGGFDPRSFAPLLTDLDVHLEISLDEAGFVRQVVSRIDMGAFIESMLSSGAEAGDLGELELVIETWQTFDNYGNDVGIIAPDAPDATSEVAGVLGS